MAAGQAELIVILLWNIFTIFVDVFYAVEGNRAVAVTYNFEYSFIIICDSEKKLS
jgi:hypothetical protein